VYCSSWYGCELWDLSDWVLHEGRVRRLYLGKLTVTCYVWYLIAFHKKMRLLVDLWILFLGVGLCIVILSLLALSWGLRSLKWTLLLVRMRDFCFQVSYSILVREKLDVGCFSALYLWFATGGFCVVKLCVRGHCSTWGAACEAIALREGLLWLGSYDSALLNVEFFSIIDSALSKE